MITANVLAKATDIPLYTIRYHTRPAESRKELTTFRHRLARFSFTYFPRFTDNQNLFFLGVFCS
jgi:hypothetical protein